MESKLILNMLNISLFYKEIYHILGDDAKKLVMASPSKLVEYLANNRFQYILNEIEGWDIFEVGDKSYSKDEVKEWIYSQIPDGSLLLITDEGIKDSICFNIKNKAAFDDFMTIYSYHYEMRFIQAADYLAYFPQQNRLNIIYHEGMLISFDLGRVVDRV